MLALWRGPGPRLFRRLDLFWIRQSADVM